MGLDPFTLSVGSTLLGSALQSESAGDAANAQRDATAADVAERKRQFDLIRADTQPYRDVGVNALGQLVSGINTPVNPQEVMSDPGYQFGLNQGQQAIDRKIAAMGGRVSGRAIKEAARYGNDYATTKYTAADQRREVRLNRLAALAGIGQTATGASAQAGLATANGVGNALSSQGDATAASRLAQGNIWGNTANQIAALYRRGNTSGASFGGPLDGFFGGTGGSGD